MAIAIKVENLSKAYRLGEIGTGTLSRDLERWFALVRGKEDPFLIVGETNDRTAKGSSDVVWSLKDINFEIQQGDAVGIIGRNGAGKSTLLKLLSRVTSPSEGDIKVKGRIASLLEVGTGFHPELTGRENIFLNGAILGMRKKEITRKFDEIVDFAGVDRYIDTPVKRYSSGMYVRLAFAVAAHLDSEILIVDEVLAVGDAEFQKKCLGKMGDVSKGEGRTVLFVSHNIASITTLTNQCIYLKNGQLLSQGFTKQVVEKYLDENKSQQKFGNISHFRRNKEYNKSDIRIKSIVCNENQQEVPILTWNKNIDINIDFDLESEQSTIQIVINLFLRNDEGILIYSISSSDYNYRKTIDRNNKRVVISLKECQLSGDKYFLDIGINNALTNKVIDVIQEYPIFEINDESFYLNWADRPKGITLKPNIQWA